MTHIPTGNNLADQYDSYRQIGGSMLGNTVPMRSFAYAKPNQILQATQASYTRKACVAFGKSPAQPYSVMIW